jgi:hypothetical protein
MRYNYEPDATERPKYNIIDTEAKHPYERIVARHVSLMHARLIIGVLNGWPVLLGIDLAAPEGDNARN